MTTEASVCPKCVDGVVADCPEHGLCPKCGGSVPRVMVGGTCVCPYHSPPRPVDKKVDDAACVRCGESCAHKNHTGASHAVANKHTYEPIPARCLESAHGGISGREYQCVEPAGHDGDHDFVPTPEDRDRWRLGRAMAVCSANGLCRGRCFYLEPCGLADEIHDAMLEAERR